MQVFHKQLPLEAVDLVSRLLQYSPNLRCSAVRKFYHLRIYQFHELLDTCNCFCFLKFAYGVQFGNLNLYFLARSWRHVLTLSSMIWETPMHACLTDEHYLLCSILRLKVCLLNKHHFHQEFSRHLAHSKHPCRVGWCICWTAAASNSGTCEKRRLLNPGWWELLNFLDA